jgi:hypothetical protein
MTAEKKEEIKARGAEKKEEIPRADSFATTKLWDVPGRDFLFKDFQNDPELSALLWHANNGGWRDREPRMLFAYLGLHKKLVREKNGDEVAEGADVAESRIRRLCGLNIERLEDRVSLCRVVHEHINESDWESINDWQVTNKINCVERAALEWLVTEGLDCGDDCRLLREKRKPAPILDSWAKSLIGLKLKVPGRWWANWPDSDSTPYDCEIVDVDYEVGEAEVEEEDDKRYFVMHCEDDNRRYPMEYKHIREYQHKAEQKKKFDVPVEAHLNPIDEEFEKLCKRSLGYLNASNHESVYEEDYKSIEEEAKRILGSQFVTPEKQRELGKTFLKTQGRGVPWGEVKEFEVEGENFASVDAPLLTCASCGFRSQSIRSTDEDVTSLFKHKDVKSLCWAELDDTQRSEHQGRMGKPPMRLPINDKGEEDVFEPWRAYSRWPPEKPKELTKDRTLPDWMFCKNDNGELDRTKPKYFHLHPEFVQEFTDDNGMKDFKVKLCPWCYNFEPSTKSKAPIRSIAGGIDFGSPSRVGLVPLTLRERQMISKVRHYSNAIKIESNTGRQKEHSHSAIKGHSIMFEHDSPRVVKDLLSAESINDSIDIHFVGPEGQYDHLAKKALGSAHISARSFAVYQWLKVLKEVNEMYSHDTDMEDFPIVVERIDKCNKALVEGAMVVTADKETARETDVGRDDIRGVRVSSGCGEVPAALNVEEVSIVFSLDTRCISARVPPHAFLLVDSLTIVQPVAFSRFISK